MRETETVAEVRRDLEICNACRYCEGYCAVFPAMTERRAFTLPDLAYLANLCHGCKGCYHACQFSPPHPFGINLPKAFAELRQESYEAYAWPAPLARLYRRNGTVVALAAAGGIALVLALAMILVPARMGTAHAGSGAFYAVIPWAVMAGTAGAAFLFALLALAIGGIRFWRDIAAPPASAPARPLPQAVATALADILTLRNLGGGGHGCNDADESFSQGRRHLHHALFYGFMLCFAATSVATLYDHFLGLPAPYPVFSLPVLLGTAGGVLMTIGAAGLIRLKIITDPVPVARRLIGGEYAMLLLLAAAALSGLALLAWRTTAAMPGLLCVHLGIILALFLLLPYSKMVHGLYRGLALLKAAKERKAAA